MKKLAGFILAGLIFAGAPHAFSDGVIQTQMHLTYEGKTYLFDIYKGKGATAPQPGLLVLPEFWGKDDLEGVEAKKLAAQGYVVLVMDVYGNGEHTKSAKQAYELTKKAEAHGFLPIYKLVSQAIELLRKRKDVDPKRIGAVGFGYGGGIATNVAKRANDDLKAVVSFYGGLKSIQTLNMVGQKPAILYIHPTRDNYAFDDQIKNFENHLNENKVKVQVVDIKDAYYGFVHPGIESYGGDTGNTFMYYDKKSSDQAWKIMTEFLAKNL